jgi:hypothetical protein
LADFELGKVTWDKVPNQCKIRYEKTSAVGNSEVRGPENDYPTLI